MTAVAVQTSSFEQRRTFLQCCTIFMYSTFVSYCTLYSTNCTQFRKFTQTSFIWSPMNICIVLHSISEQHSTDCTQYTNIRAVHNWTAVCMCSCTQTPKSQMKTQEITASFPQLIQCSDGPRGGRLSACPSARFCPMYADTAVGGYLCANGVI